jgi:asparagine synthase (glutamine-hydrolysing)
VDALDALLRRVVKQRMMSDVPLGAFLSGGIDSSIITALMQSQSERPVKTFTIGFSETRFDEAPYAKAVAEHLKTDHTELYVSPQKAAAIIPELPTIYDEPFADSSQIPTFLVSQLARQQVTVALSGDGGDELFGGYNRYIRGPQIWKFLSMTPTGMRRIAARMILSIHAMYKVTGSSASSASWLAQKLENYYDKIGVGNEKEFYRLLCSVNPHPELMVLGGAPIKERFGSAPDALPYAEWMMLQDGLNYFPNDILTKVDRAAMANSLETRTPFTDPELITFAWQLPITMKLHPGKGKWLLRQLLYRYVPKALIERPKTGFSVPIGAWLRGPLRSWAEDLLAVDTLKRQGYLNPAAVQAMWHTHQSGQRDMEHKIWNVLMFQTWLANNS